MLVAAADDLEQQRAALAEAREGATFSRRPLTYTRPSLLIVDEVGFLPLDAERALAEGQPGDTHQGRLGAAVGGLGRARQEALGKLGVAPAALGGLLGKHGQLGRQVGQVQALGQQGDTLGGEVHVRAS